MLLQNINPRYDSTQLIDRKQLISIKGLEKYYTSPNFESEPVPVFAVFDSLYQQIKPLMILHYQEMNRKGNL